MRREAHLELLLSRPVLARNGRPVGRIEEVRVAQRGQGAVVEAYLLGPHALLERLSVRVAGGMLLGWLQARGRARYYRVRWDQLDLSDPEHPRLRCAAEDLEGAAPAAPGRARRRKRP